MKYQVEIIINRPLTEVIQYFDSYEHLQKWQPGLQKVEHLEGIPGQKGAKTQLIYLENGRNVEMIETILNRNFPDIFTATYEAKGVYNEVENHFFAITPDTTKWVNHNVFQFSGVMKFIGFFMRTSFPKQTLKDMNFFKTYVESQ
ncbi:hypothetical protein NEF87_003150 [Candidatus Lokiarchaeum ossiferum]|uniref:SRPBCC family protein n=1 Tax=Candidatus Lokiarchaeum ossiferum TaxID=2951803 RepID=A0ABY6HTV5_9ARCH|nr:hypothetical protein NEF87_003150 [Candidatus Lokiarchaeum sp. B-35]